MQQYKMLLRLQIILKACLLNSLLTNFLKDGIAALQDCLEIQPENSDALKAIGDAFK